MRDRLRLLLPAFLAVAFPGLGHVYLRRWGRAVVWHATIVGGAVALYLLYDAGPVDPLPTPQAFAASLPSEVSVPITFLVGLSAIDAYLVGKEAAVAERRVEAMATAARARANRDGTTPEAVAAGDGPAAEPDAANPTMGVNCPTCGRETDADIDFCHWCTEPFPWTVDRD